MTSTRDRRLVEGIRSGRTVGVVVARDPGAVADELREDAGTMVVDGPDLAAAVAATRVRIAELVVERARQREARTVPGSPGGAVPHGPDDADHAADRQAVRFALVILLLALPAGIAVHVADGLLLAPALPAAALVALGVVVLVHRRQAPRPVDAVAGQVAATPSEDVEASPSVRAARAHLRRQQAAWKVTWWERDLAVPALDAWSLRAPVAAPITLVAVDAPGDVDDGALEAMTATVPAAVRVVVLRSG